MIPSSSWSPTSSAVRALQFSAAVTLSVAAGSAFASVQAGEESSLSLWLMVLVAVVAVVVLLKWESRLKRSNRNDTGGGDGGGSMSDGSRSTCSGDSGCSDGGGSDGGGGGD